MCLLNKKRVRYTEGHICLVSDPNLISCQVLEVKAFLYNLLSFSLHVLKCV